MLLVEDHRVQLAFVQRAQGPDGLVGGFQGEETGGVVFSGKDNLADESRFLQHRAAQGLALKLIQVFEFVLLDDDPVMFAGLAFDLGLDQGKQVLPGPHFQIKPQRGDGEFGFLVDHLLAAFVQLGGEQAGEAVFLPLAHALHHPQHGAHRPVGVLGVDGSAGIAHHERLGGGGGGEGSQQAGKQE